MNFLESLPIRSFFATICQTFIFHLIQFIISILPNPIYHEHIKYIKTDFHMVKKRGTLKVDSFTHENRVARKQSCLSKRIKLPTKKQKKVSSTQLLDRECVLVGEHVSIKRSYHVIKKVYQKINWQTFDQRDKPRSTSAWMWQVGHDWYPYNTLRKSTERLINSRRYL